MEKAPLLVNYKGYLRNLSRLCAELDIVRTKDRSACERKVITKAHAKWGDKAPEHFNGSFAYVVKDIKSGEVTCVRDQMGMQPMYYYVGKNLVFCSSSIREIIGATGLSPKLDMYSTQMYLRYGYPAGETTVFSEIKKLMPGHMLKWTKEKGIKVSRYFDTRFAEDESLSEEDCINLIYDTAKEIIKDEEPEEAGSFLSGGVDSSFLLSLLGVKNAYTASYEETEFDESDLAKETASLLGKDLTKLFVSPDDYFKSIPYVMENMELPLGDASAIPFALGCKNVAKSHSLCYSGEGADEFFGGYHIYGATDRYTIDKSRRYMGCSTLLNDSELKSLVKDYVDDFDPKAILSEIYDDKKAEGMHGLMMLTDIKLFLDGDIYLNVAKMSEAAGLTISAPFSDIRMFNAAAKIPSKYKLFDGTSKYVFRKAASRNLPEDIAFRKKVGFAVPIRKWLKDDRFIKDIEGVLFGDESQSLFNVEFLKGMWDEYIAGKDDLWRKLYGIYAFLVWHRQFM